VENGQLDTWSEDLRVIAVALENTEMAGLLDSPQVPASVKIDIIKQVLGDSVERLALNLVSLLAVRTLCHLVPGILDEYERLVDAHGGIERAEVVSAVDLNDAQRSAVLGVVEDIVGTEVRLTTRVEPEILGGLIVRVGDRVMDGSVRARLREMRRRIVERS
jgi:F-type H+-transporting ATPase subunit delta